MEYYCRTLPPTMLSAQLSMHPIVHRVDLHETKEQLLPELLGVVLRHVVLLRRPDDEDRHRHV
jgi:hypothetical protein